MEPLTSAVPSFPVVTSSSVSHTLTPTQSTINNFFVPRRSRTVTPANFQTTLYNGAYFPSSQPATSTNNKPQQTLSQRGQKRTAEQMGTQSQCNNSQSNNNNTNDKFFSFSLPDKPNPVAEQWFEDTQSSKPDPFMSNKPLQTSNDVNSLNPPSNSRTVRSSSRSTVVSHVSIPNNFPVEALDLFRYDSPFSIQHNIKKDDRRTKHDKFTQLNKQAWIKKEPHREELTTEELQALAAVSRKQMFGGGQQSSSRCRMNSSPIQNSPYFPSATTVTVPASSSARSVSKKPLHNPSSFDYLIFLDFESTCEAGENGRKSQWLVNTTQHGTTMIRFIVEFIVPICALNVLVLA